MVRQPAAIKKMLILWWVSHFFKSTISSGQGVVV